jgi:hypothetical protein
MVRCETVPTDPLLPTLANFKRVQIVSSDEGEDSDEGNCQVSADKNGLAGLDRVLSRALRDGTFQHLGMWAKN